MKRIFGENVWSNSFKEVIEEKANTALKDSFTILAIRVC